MQVLGLFPACPSKSLQDRHSRQGLCHDEGLRAVVGAVRRLRRRLVHGVGARTERAQAAESATLAAAVGWEVRVAWRSNDRIK